MSPRQRWYVSFLRRWTNPVRRAVFSLALACALAMARVDHRHVGRESLPIVHIANWKPHIPPLGRLRSFHPIYV